MIKHSGGKTAGVFTMLIFCAFAAGILLVLMLGAGVYQNVADGEAANDDQRLALSYIETKLRHGDTAGHIYTANFPAVAEAIPTLFIEETYGKTVYHTMIYYADGWIRELYCEKGLALNPSSGAAILPARALSFAADDDGLLHICCVDDTGTSLEMLYALRCREVAAL